MRRSHRLARLPRRERASAPQEHTPVECLVCSTRAVVPGSAAVVAAFRRWLHMARFVTPRAAVALRVRGRRVQSLLRP